MLDFVLKIIRKLKIKHIWCAIFRPRKIKKESVRLVSMHAREEANRFLQSKCPQNESSCLCKQTFIHAADHDLDIILPVYNSEKYLDECLQSILNQRTTYSFRVICIDDGSMDASGKILDRYASQHENVVVLHQPNGGQAVARNKALAFVSAKYIMFVDSDDVLCEGAINQLLDAAITNGAECAQGGFVELQGLRKKRKKGRSEGICDAKKNIYGFPWGKIYKREIFCGICFPPRLWFEDTIIRFLIVFRIKRFCTISDNVYQYRKNKKSITFFAKKKIKSIDSLWVLLQCYHDATQLGYRWEQIDYEACLEHIALSVRRMRGLGKRVKKAVFVLWQDFLQRYCLHFQSPQRNELRALENAILRGKYNKYILFTCC